MIDHITIEVSDVERSKVFYEKLFAPLWYTVAFGEEGVFWSFTIGDGLFEFQKAETVGPISHVHVAFRVSSRTDVDAFYTAGLAAGGIDNGAPGPRPNYTPNYYACFVRDPDGHNIEAMHDLPR